MIIAQENSILFWPFLLYTFIVFAIAFGLIAFSYFLGERHKERETVEPYESGIITTGSARLKFSPHFYLIAMFFLVFDLEAVFIITWAIAFREAGWFGYIGISVFIFILIAVLVYEWRIGALDFGPDGKKILKAFKRIKEKRLV